MTRAAPARGPETTALLALLTTAGLLAGDAERPAGGGWPGQDTTQTFAPYVVLYPGVTVDVDGPVADPDADTVNEYQVTAVGVTRASAQVLADKAREALLNTPLSVDGRSVQLVEWTGGRPAERDDDSTPSLFSVVDLYSVSSTPA